MSPDVVEAQHECFLPPILMTGYCHEGEQWTCPTCGSIYEHTCYEDEGCMWEYLGLKRLADRSVKTDGK